MQCYAMQAKINAGGRSGGRTGGRQNPTRILPRSMRAGGRAATSHQNPMKIPTNPANIRPTCPQIRPKSYQKPAELRPKSVPKPMAGNIQQPGRQNPAKSRFGGRIGFDFARLWSNSGLQNGPIIEPKSIPRAIMLQMQKSLKNIDFFNVFGLP